MTRRALIRSMIVCAMAAGIANGDTNPVHVVAFGSCAHQDRSQAFWQPILDVKPDLFIFAGDNIYADTTEPEIFRRTYAKLGGQPGFRALKARVPILATWDDHDYGRDDAGAEFEGKEASHQAFCDFWEVPADDPRRRRPGVYDAAIFGPVGRRLQVILLDTRTFRSRLRFVEPPAGSEGRYGRREDDTSTMLGDAQWAWLRARLREPADVRLLVSSIQLVAEDHYWEKWANLPQERLRLFRLLAETRAAGVVVLSGDRHHADLSCLDDSEAGYPIYDLTASGLNMARGPRAAVEPNLNRVGPGPIGAHHFGVVRLDWEATPPAVTLEIRLLDGSVALSRTIPLADLQPPRATP